MIRPGMLWECVCGYKEYSEELPEECPNCHNFDTFIQMHSEISDGTEEDLEEPIMEKKLKSKSSKSGRKKR